MVAEPDRLPKIFLARGGRIAGGMKLNQDVEVCLNDAGRTIEKWWFELNRKFPMVETDEFVIMPNHFHGVVIITDVPVGADLRVGPVPEGEHPTQQGAPAGAPLQAGIQW